MAAATDRMEFCCPEWRVCARAERAGQRRSRANPGDAGGRPLELRRATEPCRALEAGRSAGLGLVWPLYARQRWLPHAAAGGPGIGLEAPKAEFRAQHGARPALAGPAPVPPIGRAAGRSL